MPPDSGIYPPPPRNSVGLAALVLGILGLALSFIPFTGEFVAIPCAVAALITAYIGYDRVDRVDRGIATNRADAVVGGLLGLLALMTAMLINLAVYSGQSS
ncbi:hypothetical protein [Nocardia sp. AG03]|uniref:hypothetical protein n=1 Tax=Nocardia sp. AG03 TaxID=3025312 RepID=UPI00241862BC|nr:hypothetical protein [Nocardia sp. AG03]